MNTASGFSSFREFYPYYLGEHQNLTCRRLHVVGSTGVLLILALVLAQVLAPIWLLAVPASGRLHQLSGPDVQTHSRADLAAGCSVLRLWVCLGRAFLLRTQKARHIQTPVVLLHGRLGHVQRCAHGENPVLSHGRLGLHSAPDLGCSFTSVSLGGRLNSRVISQT